MDEDDLVLVIDLDDEREEARDNKKDHKNVDKLTDKEDNSVKRNSDEVNLTIFRESRKEDDDDILVIDDGDDDYEHSVQKLVNVANEFGNTYRKNKYDEAEEQQMRPELYERVKEGNVARFLNPGTFYEEQVQVNSSNRKQRLIHDAYENHQHIRAKTSSEIGLCERRYVTNDLQYLEDKNTFRTSRLERTPHTQNKIDLNKPDALGIDEYHDAIKMYEYNRAHRFQDISRNDNYTNAAINRAACIYTFKPDDTYKRNDHRQETNRETNSHIHRPDIASSMRDYRHDSIYRTKNEHTFVPDANSAYDNYERAAMNRDLYNLHLRPEVALRYNEYRPTAINDCSRALRPDLLSNDDCLLRHNDINRTPLNNAYAEALDNYWHTIMSRHTYRPDVIGIDEYGRAIISRNAYDTLYGVPAVGIDPYRSELAHIYRSDLDNIDFYRETMLRRNIYYPERVGMYSYIPQVYHSNARRPHFEEPYKRDEEILNLSRKQESNHESTMSSTREKNIEDSKLRTILSTANQETMMPLTNSGYPNIHISKHNNFQSSRTSKDNFGYSETVRSMNKSEAPTSNVNVFKPGVSVRIDRPETVIFSTKDASPKIMSNTPAQTDTRISTTGRETDSHNLISTKTDKDNKTVSSNYSKKCHIMHDNNELHEETHRIVVGDRGVNKDIQDTNIQFLAVFFRRVKELVKETFPEFSKSLEREVENLGQVTNRGKMKTDIQFICPLYCSVSTYSLPHFGSVDDDNKIEIHINRVEICDVCSCIQRCYKLYKKKYLISTANEKNENTHGTNGRKRKIDTEIMDGSVDRNETVICKRKGNDEENTSMCGNDTKVHKSPSIYSIYSNADEILQEGFPLSCKNAQGVADKDSENPAIRLNRNSLLDSLSILNFKAATNNIDKSPSHNTNKMYIDESAIDNNEKKITNDSNNTIDKDRYPRDDAEANLILSLSYNEITNADIISSKLKNKSGRKPGAVFTCHICSCMFTYFTSFVSHMQKEHDINGIDEEIPDECIARKCPFCGIHSKQKYHNDHVKRAHPQIYTHKGEPSEIQMMKADTKWKSKKRKFIFTCLVCHKNLKSREVKRHREKEHKGLNVAKMFTKKLSTLD